MIQREDVRVKKDTPKTYRVSELKEYLGPEIDWNRYEIRFMSKQIYKAGVGYGKFWSGCKVVKCPIGRHQTAVFDGAPPDK